MIVPLNPSLSSLRNIISLFTVSNALLKSKNMELVNNLLSKVLVQSSTYSSIASLVLHPDLNPYCPSKRILLSSINLRALLFISLSIHFERIGNIEIGLKLSTILFLFHLCNSIIFEIFNLAGKQPSHIDKLKMLQMTEGMIEDKILLTNIGIAFTLEGLSWRDKINLLTYSTETDVEGLRIQVQVQA